MSHLGPQSVGLLWDISQLWTVSEPHCTWGQPVNAGGTLLWAEFQAAQQSRTVSLSVSLFGTRF